MQQYSKNPRKISESKLEQLKLNIQELGDLSGIVHDLNTDEMNPPKGFAIMMKGKHLCKTMRGVKKDGSMTVLHCTGIFKTDKDIQKQFIDIAEKQIQ